MPELGLPLDWRVDLVKGQKQYGENVLFYGLNLAILPGNVTRISGPNGSGKTQLLRALCGISELDRGTISIRCGEKTRMLRSARDRMAVFRFVQAHPSAVSSLTTAEFAYAVSHALHPFALHARSRSATAFFERLKGHLECATGRYLEKNERVSRLSIGQQKRLMLAATLHAQDSPCVLAVDEPLAGVDAEGILRTLELLREASKAGFGLLIAEHREEIEALEFDRIVQMPFGLADAEGETGEPRNSARELAWSESGMCIAFRSVRAGYPQWEVDSENLRLPAAGVAFVAGANGAGKTGFLRGILGMEPATTCGEIEIGGEIVKDLASKESRGEVRYMSQDRAAFPELTTGDAFSVAASKRAQHDTMLQEMVTRVGRKKRVMHLSSGNRAVFSLAQTLSSEPELALLDEPFANVDPPNRIHLLEMIEYARRKFGTAFIIVEHGNVQIPGADYYTVSREGSRAYIQRKSG